MEEHIIMLRRRTRSDKLLSSPSMTHFIEPLCMSQLCLKPHFFFPSSHITFFFPSLIREDLREALMKMYWNVKSVRVWTEVVSGLLLGSLIYNPESSLISFSYVLGYKNSTVR